MDLSVHGSGREENEGKEEPGPLSYVAVDVEPAQFLRERCRSYT